MIKIDGALINPRHVAFAALKEIEKEVDNSAHT